VSNIPATKKVKAGPNRVPPSKTVPPLPKMGPAKKVDILKITRLKAKPRPRGTSEIELDLAMPIGVSKKFHMLGVAASSHTFHATGVAATHVARVSAFDNLHGDSSLDVHGTPSPKRTREKRVFCHPWCLVSFCI
jgi:hypothetical protein